MQLCFLNGEMTSNFFRIVLVEKARQIVVNSSKELKRDFERDRHLQFMIERKSDSKLIGTIYSYNYKRADGYAFITTFIVNGFRKRGYGAEADALFLMHLFKSLNFLKFTWKCTNTTKMPFQPL